jgi:hypothetical protein
MTHYFYQQGKEPIEIAPERWRWEIYYEDDSVLKQFDDDGAFHPFSDIDQTKPIHKVQMVNDDQSPIVIYWKSGYKLIHFYTKNIMRVQAGIDIETQPLESFRIYVVGYQYGHEKVMLAIMPDDGVIVIDDIERLQVS